MLESPWLYVQFKTAPQSKLVPTYFWLPRYLYSTISLTRHRTQIQSCKISKYFAHNKYPPPQFYDDFCLKIYLLFFVPFTKPWRCQVYVDLFPNMVHFVQNISPTYYSKKFRTEPLGNDRRFVFPDGLILSSVPVTHIIVSQEDIQLTNLQTALASIICSSSEQLCQETYFCAHVTANTRTSPLSLLTGSIVEFRFITLSYSNYFRENNSDMSFIISKTASEEEALENINKFILSAPPNESLIWNIDTSVDPQSPHHRFLHIFLSYENPSRTYFSPQERIGHLHAKVWLSIFQNYTFTDSQDRRCFHGKLIRKESDQPKIRSYFFLTLKYAVSRQTEFPSFAMQYQSDMNNLRFISCAPVTRTSLPFGELVNIYDAWVWVCLAVCVVTTSITTTFWESEHESLFLSTISTLQILVGQGGFPDRVIERVPLRFAALLFLFMAVIISEGYKNSNVYNMISPRKSISKRFFDELVSDNFTVYVKSHTIDFRMFHYPKIYNYRVSEHLITSELVHVPSEIKSLELKYAKQIENNPALQSHSKLFPLLLSKIDETIQSHKQ